MILFLIKRLLSMVPTLFGITLATFVVLNLLVGSPESSSVGEALSPREDPGRDVRRSYGLDLPLFVNLDIDDLRARVDRAVTRLADARTRDAAVRDLARRGGAVVPFLVPSLPSLKGETKVAALDALKRISVHIGVDKALAASPDPSAFWKRYFETYGSDFMPARAARLVRRLARYDDRLALSELRTLDTFCLPYVMETLGAQEDGPALARLTRLASDLTGREDAVEPGTPLKERALVKARWREWWRERDSDYTAYEGAGRVAGAVTQTRYFEWLSRIVTFDFGLSMRDGRPVLEKLGERLPVTLLLSVLALLFAYGLAIPLGTLSAVYRGRAFDRVTAVALFCLYSLPSFWVAMLLVRYLGGAGHLDLFPAQGLATPGSQGWPPWERLADLAHHLVLPVFCLSFVSMAMLARYQRVGMLEVIDRDYMRTARAKGLSRSAAILRHGLRNGVVPVVTMLGVQLPYLVSGSVVVEQIFGIPGMGQETFEAIRARDHAWLMAVVTVTAIMTMVGVVLADAVYALVDPRVVPGRRREVER
ncbi:MAG: ABC transporter permease subunit [Deltaproteobacteria bacterium]|nr:ABC transporter permease subunit [Deltaproteobacteria bacterium]